MHQAEKIANIPCEHLIQNHPKCPHIYFRGVASPLNHFRCVVVSCPTHSHGLLTLGNDCRQAVIDNFDVPVKTLRLE